MRAKWLWTTWAYLGLASVILLEVLFVTFNVIFIIPKFQRLMRDGMIDSTDLDEQGVSWMVQFLHDVSYVGGKHTLLLILVPAAAWGLFEWRVRSEHKPFMRFAALGTAAVALMLVVILTAGSMLVPFCLAMPAMGAMSRPWAIDRVADIDHALASLERAHMKKDWPVMHEHAKQAASGARLLGHGPAATSLAMPNDAVRAHEMREQVRGLQYMSKQVLLGIEEHNEQKLDAALQDFRKAFEPVREAAKKLKR